MQASQLPSVKLPVPWANAAGTSYIRQIPVTSQIGITSGAASLADGFPPLTMTSLTAGGTPPAGQDMNGILNEITAWTRWQNAGGLVTYDSVFVSAIGGYPAGALLASASTAGIVWLNTVDNNSSNPDSAGANWVQIATSAAIQSQSFTSSADGGSANSYVLTIAPAITSYRTNQLFSFKAVTANTGASTINVNGLGSVSLARTDGSALLPNDILAGQMVNVQYDGTKFQLLNPSPYSLSNGIKYFAPDTSLTTNVLTVAPAGVLAYAAGLTLEVLVANPNSGATTINVNGLGSKSVTFGDASALTANALVAGMVAVLVYDGTRFELCNPSPYAWIKGAEYAIAGGTANALTLALNYTPAAYTDGMGVSFRATANNTGAATISVAALGAVGLVRQDGTALRADDIVAGGMHNARYSGPLGKFELMTLAPTAILYQSGNYSVASGTNTLAATLGTAPSSQAALLGVPLRLLVANTNTGAVTLNVNGLGAQPVVTPNGNPLGGNELGAGLITHFIWNGSAYQIASGAAGSPAAAGSYQTFSNTNVTVLAGTSVLATTATFTAPRTASLPPASTVAQGQKLYIVDSFGALTGANTLTIVPNGTDTINGLASSLILASPYAIVVLVCDGSSRWTVSQNSAASGSTAATYVNTNRSITPGVWLVDTSAGPVTLTLANLPSTGDNYTFIDGFDTFSVNNLTINPNGATLLGFSGNLVCDVMGVNFELAFKAGNWSLN